MICGCSAILRKSWEYLYIMNLNEFEFNEKTFLIGHGDGKGPSDKGYKRG
jgi:hypothetical protein